MHVTVRKYAGKGALIDKLVPPVRDGLVPLLKSAPGFKGYCAFGSDDGHIVSVSIFDDQPSATRATEQVRDWVKSNLRPVHVSLEQDHAVYVEPNVWVRHTVPG